MPHLTIGFLIASVRMEVNIIDSVKDNMIVAMPLVDVRCNHILVLSLEPFVGKLLTDFMRLFRRDFINRKGLDQMSGDHLRHLHSLLSSKISCPLKFLRCGIAGSATIGRDIELVICFLRIKNVCESLVHSSSDWLDFSNRHISACLSFSSATSSS